MYKYVHKSILLNISYLYLHVKPIIWLEDTLYTNAQGLTMLEMNIHKGDLKTINTLLTHFASVFRELIRDSADNNNGFASSWLLCSIVSLFVAAVTRNNANMFHRVRLINATSLTNYS